MRIGHSSHRLRRRQARQQRRRRQVVERLEPRLLLAGNDPPQIVRPVSDLTLEAGIPFTFNLRPASGVVFGFDVGGIDIRATDNYFASAVQFFESWEDITFTGNTVINDDPYRVVEVTDVASTVSPNDYTWNDNEYITDTRKAFIYDGATKTWDQWRDQTGLDQASTLSSELNGTTVTIRPNQYEPGRGHAAVYNWDRLDQVSLDLSSVVQPGAAYEIYNVLDLKGSPIVSGVYTGGLVSVPMMDVVSPIPIGHNPVAPLVVNKEFSSFLILSAAATVPAIGNEFYVSTTGTPQGDGSQSDPWDLQTAMSHPASVSAGDTIWVTGGTYHGKFTSSLSGTAQNPIHVRERPGEEAIIDLNDGSPLRSEVITINGRYTHYQGLEVFSSDLTSRTTLQAGSWPADINRGNINVFGDHVKLINWEIHDLNKGLGFWSAADGGEVYGSLIYNNGWSGPDREHGHGIYSQNKDFTRLFADNILFNQFRHGIKIYGSNAASLKNYVLDGNISFNNGAAASEGFNGAWQILIGGGTLAQNITVNENYTYASGRHIVDPNAGDALTYSARLSNGQPLPSWLAFYGDEGYFVGTPSPGDAGTISVELTARDASGASVTDVFELTVNPPNQPPTVVSRIDDATVHRNESFDIDVSSHFDDAEDGNQLQYSIAPPTGGVLPAWIGVDVDTGVITGTSDEPGTIAIEVTAFDRLGRFTSDVFNLSVDNQSLQVADVRVDVTDGGIPVTLGSDASYTLVVSNHGSVTAQDVVVTASATSGFASAFPSTCLESGGSLTCSLGSLASGASTQMEVTVTTTDPGTLSLQSQVATSTSESNTGNNTDSASTFVNALPDAVNDSRQISEDAVDPATGNLTSNDQDANGTETLSVIQVNQSTNPLDPLAGNFGTFQWDADGSYSYTLDRSDSAVQSLAKDQTLTDSFSYTVSDALESDSAVIAIQIQGTNDNPDASDLALSVNDIGPAIAAAVLVDDVDSDDDASSLTYEWLTLPARGQWVDLGQGQFRFDPANQFPELLIGQQAVETLIYRVTDRHGATAQGVVSITVAGTHVAPPDVTISQATVSEDATQASFAIGLSAPSDIDITLTLATDDVTATAGDDYTATTGQVTIPAGTTAANANFNVTIIDDADVEPNESFTVSIQSVDSGTVGDITAVGIGTIMDNDFSIGPVQVLDDGDAGVDFSGAWGGAIKKGHEDDFHYTTAGPGNKTATWTFDVAPGQYRISASWHAWSNRATNAPFTISSGAVELATVQVDQQQTPTDLIELNTAFQDLGTFNIINDQLVVELSNRADGVIIADAIRIQRLGVVVQGPEARVTFGGENVENGSGVVDFGDVEMGSTSIRTVTVTNFGTSDLTLVEPIDVPTGFSLASSFGATTLAPFESTTFDLQIDTSSMTTRSGEVSFTSNDSANPRFSFTALGTVVPVSTVQVIDNGAAGYDTQGQWGTIVRKGHEGDFQYATADAKSKSATWNFAVQPGQYKIAATWREWTNRATDAPFSILVDGSPLSTVTVNQRIAPNGFVDDGTTYHELGTFSIVGNQLSVVLSNLADGLVVADAIRIERLGNVVAGPEIHVTAGGNVEDGTGVVDFGDVVIGTTQTKTVTVSNIGTNDLVLSAPVSLPSGFTVASTFGSTTLSPGASTTLEIELDTSSLGNLNGAASFSSNDLDESPFDFTIQGNIVPLPDIQIRDNSDVGFALSGTWTTVNRNGHQDGFVYANSGTGANTASWTFELNPGQYRLFATWRHHGNRAPDAAFTVYDGSTDLGTISVNQTLAPNGVVDGGSKFQEFGTFNVSGSQLVVVLTDAAGGLVVADAIRIERIGD